MNHTHHPLRPRRDSAPARPLGEPTRGVIVPLITPLSSRDVLDVPGLDRLIEHVLAGGVHGIFLLGTTGESATLCGRMRRELVAQVCRQVDRRVPVLVGISDTAIAESLRLADDAAQVGADAVVITAPYYLPLEPRELVNYVRMVSTESPLPVFLYNMPELTKSWFSSEVLAQLLDLDNVVGLKDSSGDTDYFEAVRTLVARRPDWSLLIGSEAMMAEAVRDGAHGAVAGGANVRPELLVNLYEAAVAGDEQRIAALQQQVLELAELYRHGSYAVGTIRGIKSALSQMGICSELMAGPFLPVSDVQRAAIAEQVRRQGLLDGDSPTGVPTARIDAVPGPHRIYGSPASGLRAAPVAQD